MPAEPAEPVGPSLRLELGTEPATLDPAEATNPAEGTLLGALLDPLVRFEDGVGAVPALAERWEVLDGGRTIVFRLRPDGVWTNGDPVTAEDFVYAWKRAMAPRFASTNANLFADIVGAAAYTACDAASEDCAALRDAVGVEALDDVTLEVELKRPVPWFPELATHWAFLPVHQPTIERFKKRWAEPANIVTNGPFTLADWVPGASLTLDRWSDWHDASSVAVGRVEASAFAAPGQALAVFGEGALDACLTGGCLPADGSRVSAATEAIATVPAPSTVLLGINTERVPDVRERRAIALALDRRALVAQLDAPSAPATGVVPEGVAGFELVSAAPFLTEAPKRGKARRILRRAEDAKRQLSLAYREEDEALATIVQRQLQKVGLEVTLELRAGEPTGDADLFLEEIDAQGGDAYAALAAFACGESGETMFCDPAYDKVLDRARTTSSADARYALYAELERLLTGRQGAFPAVPVTWGRLEVVRRPEVGGFAPNVLGVVDLARVTVPAS